MSCSCEACSDLDPLIDEHLVVRSECMVVCGSFTADFLNFPPSLFVQISSQKTKLGYGDTKYNLYELQGAKYYILSNTDKKVVGVFELLNANPNMINIFN